MGLYVLKPYYGTNHQFVEKYETIYVLSIKPQSDLINFWDDMI
jgi:hypothetical protein